MLRGPGVAELLVELCRRTHVRARQVELLGNALDVGAADVALLRVEARQGVVHRLALAQELVLQGDEIAAHS